MGTCGMPLLFHRGLAGFASALQIAVASSAVFPEKISSSRISLIFARTRGVLSTLLADGYARGTTSATRSSTSLMSGVEPVF